MRLTTLHRQILGIILILGVAAVVQSEEVFRYPENPTYGYLKSPAEKTDTGSVYILVHLDSRGSSGNPYTVLDSFLAWSPPQMCGAHAVSFTKHGGPDSSHLVVATLDSVPVCDTILTYVDHLAYHGRSHALPCGRVLCMGDYLFNLSDSTLFWDPQVGHRSLLIIGRVLPNNGYADLDWVMESEIPAFTSDFAQALYVRFSPRPGYAGSDSITTIRAWDFAEDRSKVVQRVIGHCWDPRRRAVQTPLYCRSVDGISNATGAAHLCVVTDSIPRSIFEPPDQTGITEYFLYPDSIVILTRGVCGSGIGLERHVIHE
ncbi:MAG: hypothetical protein KKA42_13000 [candidate division Zixibacteria bacterium]|nr:hypothetical protein [candidate division Zixibacteria bacterium]